MEQLRKQPPDDFPYLRGVEDKCEKAKKAGDLGMFAGVPKHRIIVGTFRKKRRRP